MKRWLNAKVLIPLLGFVILAAAAFYLYPRPPAIPPYLQKMGGDFALQSADGTVHLSDFRGKVVLLYFGYTHCPDVCPMALGTIAAAMNKLGKTQQEQVQGIFVSLDPRRDTPKILKQYATFFDPHIIGATGTPDALKKIAPHWRLDFKVPEQPADADYAVEHSTFIYLVNPDGQVAALFDEKTEPKKIADAVRKWLR